MTPLRAERHLLYNSGLPNKSFQPSALSRVLLSPVSFVERVFSSFIRGISGAAGELQVVGAPSFAWRFLRSESPLWVRSNQPPIPSVAVV